MDIRQAIAENNFGREWQISPRAFPLSKEHVQFLEKLGQKLLKFQQACDNLYRRSLKGTAPEWIARWLNAGKPQDLLTLAQSASQKTALPLLIRPDLLITEQGWALTEIDSIPGGVGTTAFLSNLYAQHDEDILGGARGLYDAMHRLFPQGSVVVAEEAKEYAPEWEWLFGKDRVKKAEGYRFTEEPVYRFFECFDWENLESIRSSWNESVTMMPPLKPHLEEKLWLALLWMQPLKEFWRRELGDGLFKEMLNLVPQGWILDPQPLSPHAVYPGLNIQSWEELKSFSQKERDLILKISGFSPLAWGSRGVLHGSDANQQAWAQAVQEALDGFEKSPYILQRYHKPKLLSHVVWKGDEQVPYQGRARVCPFYVVEQEQAKLQGVLVTLCPADKKIIHGMTDAVRVPATLQR